MDYFDKAITVEIYPNISYQAFHYKKQYYQKYYFKNSMTSKNSFGGTSPQVIKQVIKQAEKL